MTLTEKLAALPPLSSVDSWKEDGIGPLVVYAKDYNALLARNALLREAQQYCYDENPVLVDVIDAFLAGEKPNED